MINKHTVIVTSYALQVMLLTGKAMVLDRRISRHLLAYDGHKVG